MSNRRTFLKSGAVASAAALLPASQAGTATASSQGVQSYKRLGRTNLQVSDISFGASQLQSGQEDLVRHALDLGVNYFDSAVEYTRGVSETVLGNALKGKRDKVYLVSKTVTSERTKGTAMMRDLETSLKRQRTDYIDVYLNHRVNHIDILRNTEWWDFIDKAKAQGKIRFSGISGHAGRLADCLEYSLDNDLIDVMLTAYNFGQDPAFYEGITQALDWVATQPDLPRLIKKAQANDVGVVVMKTLMGGRLNDLRAFEKDGATFAQAALKWVLSNPDVDALIISMTSKAKIDEFLVASGATSMASHELGLLERYAELNSATFCRHGCNSCDGSCPYDVPISDVLRTRMYATDYQNVNFARNEYALLGAGASACVSCSGAPCLGACPHGVEIHNLCAPTHRMLA